MLNILFYFTSYQPNTTYFQWSILRAQSQFSTAHNASSVLQAQHSSWCYITDMRYAWSRSKRHFAWSTLPPALSNMRKRGDLVSIQSSQTGGRWTFMKIITWQTTLSTCSGWPSCDLISLLWCPQENTCTPQNNIYACHCIAWWLGCSLLIGKLFDIIVSKGSSGGS